MSAMRIRSNVPAAARPVAGAPLTSNMPRKSKGSPLPILIALAVLGVAGYFGWKEFDRRQKAKRAREAEYQRQLEELARREAAEAAAAAAAKQAEKKPEIVEEKVEEPKVVQQKRKTAMEVFEEDEALRKSVLAKIEEARRKSDAKPLNGFANVHFGEPLKEGGVLRWGTVMGGDAGGSVTNRGVAFAVYGPELKKSFMTLGTRPVVWVTPKTRRPYRIEFARPLACKPGARNDPETTNIVAFLSARFKSDPFIPVPMRAERPGCEYVFPMGTSSVRVAESGDQLMLVVEREDLRAEACAEAEALRQEEKAVAEQDGKILDSTRYPHREIDRKKYPGVRFKDETPRSFCGIVFASSPAESVTVVVPQQGPKGFFLDYEWAKCRPFRGFTRGRADIDSARGGVYAVRLFSVGGSEGLDDRDYFETVRASLTEHYKVQPTEKKGEGEFPELTYQVGDLRIVFGADARGGFFLSATNDVLAELAKTAPKAAAVPKRARR